MFCAGTAFCAAISASIRASRSFAVIASDSSGFPAVLQSKVRLVHKIDDLNSTSGIRRAWLNAKRQATSGSREAQRHTPLSKNSARREAASNSTPATVRLQKSSDCGDHFQFDRDRCGQCCDLDCCTGRVGFGGACEILRVNPVVDGKILFHVSKKDRDVDD